MTEVHWSLHTLAWNDPSYFFDLLSSVEQQTGAKAQTILIEHHHLGALSSREVDHRRCIILRNAGEKEFAAAHQQAITFALSHWAANDLDRRYIVIVDPDAVLEPHCLFNAERFFEAHPSSMIVLPKTLRASLEFSDTGEQREVVFQDEEDSQDPACLFVRASFASRLSWKRATDVSGLIRHLEVPTCSEAVVWHHGHPLPPPSFSAKVRSLWRR